MEVNSLGTVSEHYGGRSHVASNLPIQELSLRWNPWVSVALRRLISSTCSALVMGSSTT
jgi:hypothetical protein